MREFPTTGKIFGLESLGEDVSEHIVNEYLWCCKDECINAAIKHYEKEFNLDGFKFEDEEIKIPRDINGDIFDEDKSIVPNNFPLTCDSFIKLRGTQYEKLLVANHRIEPSPEEFEHLFPLDFGFELEYAENHSDYNWWAYSEVDEESYHRVINCYQEAAEDGNINALWCLGCAFDWADFGYYGENGAFGLSYYYLSMAIEKGHLACIPAFCEGLKRHSFYKESFLLTYVGAQKKELYCMWNLARYYLCGVVVPKDEKKAIELYESILDILDGTDESSVAFMQANYDGIDAEDLKELRQDVEKNLRIIKSERTTWRKYFDMEILKKYAEAKNQAYKEYNEKQEEGNFEHSGSSKEWFDNRIKEIMNLKG